MLNYKMIVLLCSFCGRKGHNGGVNCSAKNEVCHRCGRKGHFKVKCYSKMVKSNTLINPSFGNQYERSAKEYKSETIKSVVNEKYIFVVEDSDNEVEVDCYIGEVKMIAIIDSGSRFNLIDADSSIHLKRNNLKVRKMTSDSAKILRAYGGQQLTIRGTIEVDLNLNNVISNESFYNIL